MGDLLSKFQQYLKKEYPFLQPANSKLLLAVSGGLDSVVLTHLFIQSGHNVVLAHCNFQLRGQESERDEQFVRSLADKYKTEVLVKRFETEDYAKQHKLSIQEAARKLRYDWFKSSIVNRQSSITSLEVAKGEETSTKLKIHGSPLTTQHSSFIVTAHQANDNIETLLINFFRGTGIGGLHGIPSRQDNILRPLLFAKREEILAYAKENSLQWVEDSSNASDKYTRNFIRHHLLPDAKEIFSNVEDNLLQNIERFKEAELLYNQAVALHKSKLLEKKGDEWHIPVLKLQKIVPHQTIIWEVVKEFGFASAQVPEIIKLMHANNGSYVSSATSRVIKNRAWLIIAPQQAEASKHIIIEEGDKKVMFEGGALQIEFIRDSRFATHDSPFTVHVDASHIQFPLLLRKWKQGDYFYPLGMQKKKKLSKFFIDQKLSKTAKEKVWVLEANKKIIWVVGMRIDDRFKITASTTNSLHISFIKN